MTKKIYKDKETGKQVFGKLKRLDKHKLLFTYQKDGVEISYYFLSMRHFNLQYELLL